MKTNYQTTLQTNQAIVLFEKTAEWRQVLALSATAAATDRVKDFFSCPERRPERSS